MSNSCAYRDWRVYCRHEDGGWQCVVVSPYGVVTTAVFGPDRDGVLEAAKSAIDSIIEAHYPERRLGRYTPPTTYNPRPGQPRGLPFVAGRQRVPEEEARAYCQAVEPAS